MRPESLASLLSVAGRPARPVYLLPEPVGASGHVNVLDAQRAQRVADRVDDSGARRDRAGLADALRTQRVGRRRRDRSVDLDTRDFADAGNAVVEKSARPELACLGIMDDPVSYTHLTLPTNREV